MKILNKIMTLSILSIHILLCQINPNEITIARDSFGVPHIYAKTDAELAQKGIELAQIDAELAQIIGNDQEINVLLNGQKKSKVSSIVEIAVVTSGPKGANIFQGNDKVFIPPIQGTNVVDTTGAGDLFAAGFLFGFSKKLTLDDCGKLATKSASHIIQQYGARPVESLSKLLIT